MDQLTPAKARAFVPKPPRFSILSKASSTNAQTGSLLGGKASKPQRERPVYLEGAEVHGMRSSTQKILVTQDGDRRCFDYAQDPREQSPVPEPFPAACERLARALAHLLQRFELIAERGDPDATVTFDDEEIEALRALGYLD